MQQDTMWFDEISMPALLRHARNTYGTAMRKALVQAGYDDIPDNGLYMIGGLALAPQQIALPDLIEQMPISKSAVSLLVETLVNRCYIVVVKDDGKLDVALTERGRAAAATQAAARQTIDAELLAAVGEADISRTRRTLAVLCDIGHPGDHAAKL